MKVSDLGERRLLERIRARLPKPPGHVVVGIGDDAAVVEVARNTRVVVTTDALVEGVHFDRAFSTPADIGHKALAVNLSDLAAMGATPVWALLSLALPDGTAVEDVEALVDGLVGLANANSVALVGGNLTSSHNQIVVDVTAGGTVHPRRVLLRDGGRAGDLLFTSGTIGAAAAGLEMIKAGLPPSPANEQCFSKYRRPDARVRLGRALSATRAARAAMDSSDGLADAVRQLAEASGCGAEIDASQLPIDDGARRWWVSQGVDPVDRSLVGGDDYELVIAVPPKWRGRLRQVTRRVSDPSLRCVGVLTRTANEYVVVRDGRRERLTGGFEHW
jgi:thiamine-monophosphate kinase